MIPDTEQICRKIAREIVDGDRHSLNPIFRPTGHEIDLYYLVEDIKKLVRDNTDLPKMVELIRDIANTETKPPEFRYGDPSSINAQYSAWYRERFLEVIKGVQLFFTDLQGKQTQ